MLAPFDFVFMLIILVAAYEYVKMSIFGIRVEFGGQYT